MNKKALMLGAAAFLIAAPFGLDLNRQFLVPISAEAAANVSLEVFFNDLEPHGSWVQTEDHPYVWVPANVGSYFLKYTNCHLIYTDQYGWYFDSDEPFAPITYHYGRWGFSPDIGWYWVPGTRWAPAWVVWRRDEGHVGWAPLPPEGRGYAVDVTVRVGDVPETNWVFVPVEQFLAPQLTVVIQGGDRVHEVFTHTQTAEPVVQNNIIVNNIIDINVIQQKTNQKVVVHKVEAVGDPKQARAAAANDTAVRAFVANVEQPKENVKPKQVVDAKAAKAKQDQGRGDKANAGAAAGAGAAGDCKADASGKMPANCPAPSGQAAGQPGQEKAGAAANAQANKPAESAAKAGGAPNAEANKPAAGANAGAPAGADNCKADASGKLPANCPPAKGAAKAGAPANAEANKPATDAAGQPAVTEAKPAPGAKASGEAAAKATPKDSGAAASDSGKAAVTEGKKPAAAGQASGEAKGKTTKDCTAAQVQAGAAGCTANVGGAGAVSQDKTGANGKGAADTGNGATPAGTKQADEQAGSAGKAGGQPEVQTGQPDTAKCTPAMKSANKC
ncbi:MAG: hypothetical protein M3O31_01500 [Acidobacteriota bacterium]|nr:hypothetical protein [Acidobacteriota bacterium]